MAEVGNAFEQSLDTDDNGSIWVVFPNVPAIKYPEFNKWLRTPVILYAKIVAVFCPQWKRIDGLYGVPVLLLLFFCTAYVFLCIMF